MGLTKRLFATLGTFALFVLAVVTAQNIESISAYLGTDAIGLHGPPPAWRACVVNLFEQYIVPGTWYIAGPFGRGFVLAAILFSLPDMLTMIQRYRALRTTPPVPLSSADLEFLGPKEMSVFSHKAQTEAQSRLSQLCDCLAVAKIRYGSQPGRNLAISIAAIFRHAGWKVDFSYSPSSELAESSPGGILVEGYNEYIILNIASILNSCDVSDVRSRMMPSSLLIDSPKWNSAQKFAKISIF